MLDGDTETEKETLDALVAFKGNIPKIRER